MNNSFNKYGVFFVLFFFFGFLWPEKSWANPLDPPSQIREPLIKNHHKKRIKILSIDGGGIRGIIPAMILQNIESRLKHKKHLVNSFDVMAGTSTGGLIVMLLNTPHDTISNKPKYNVAEIVKMYNELGSKVFQNSIFQKIKSVFGWIDAKYSEQSLETLLSSYLGKTELKNTITNILVPAYEIEMDKMFFFRTIKAKYEQDRNYLLSDLARAATASPTYFRPAQISPISKEHKYTFIDGGIAVNNPSISAAVHAIELYGENNDFLIVSLGTGTNFGAKNKNILREEVQTSGLFGWAAKIVPMMMYSVNDVTNYQMQYVFNGHKHKDYHRFQVILEPQNSDLDNASPENIKILTQHAETIIRNNEQQLQEIANILNEE